jgi:hypothetical protein
MKMITPNRQQSAGVLAVNLMVTVENATLEERARGLAAARAVFGRARVSPWHAAQHLPDVWSAAETAAIEACCAGWKVKPECGLDVQPDAEKLHGNYMVHLEASDHRRHLDVRQRLGEMTLAKAIAVGKKMCESPDGMWEGFSIFEHPDIPPIAYMFTKCNEEWQRKWRTGVR